ncbi:MAG: RluA family pseudouridine synthase [Muribaculaceae bacterium]|nr:RluA family pseudouridine synthase [Muribaculaceae bacterium]
MNNPFDYSPSPNCEKAFRFLLAKLELLTLSKRREDINLSHELREGKMLGVMIAEDKSGRRQFLFAFSGQLGAFGFLHPLFVPPVFDYLQPDGYFKSKERAISLINSEILSLENESLPIAQKELDDVSGRLNSEVADFQRRCKESKAARDIIRKQGISDPAITAKLINQSRFEKAELRRIKNKVKELLAPLNANLSEIRNKINVLKSQRRAGSEALQDWLFSNFSLLNARGESKTLSEIFADTPGGIPPSGAGECCAPKLLQEAYRQGLTPLEIAEYWYGKPKHGEIRRAGEFYPACRGKCLPILTWMLEGLQVCPPLSSSDSSSSAPAEPEIIFENDLFCVVNKPSGMLSVPGKVESLSVEEWLGNRYAGSRQVKMAHRLDRDTSGLLIATFTPEAYKTIQSLFARRMVKKRYVALLEGDYKAKGIPQSGQIKLPLIPDIYDRPRQRIDHEHGKEAVTDFEFTGVEDSRSRVLLYPHTGRTHQLRVHTAAIEGLALPIAGDKLYGSGGGKNSERLLLHAQSIEFSFPPDGKHYSFEIPAPF